MNKTREGKMSAAYKCDQCGNLFKEREALRKAGGIFERYNVNFHVDFMAYIVKHAVDGEPDLCEICRKDIWAVIASRLTA